jgi:hypothetical protein
MKACRYLLLLGVCLLAAACQPNAHMKAYIDLLNTEQRLLEDDFYAADAERRYVTAEIKQLQKENETLRKRLGLSPTDPVVTTPAETVPGGSDRGDASPRLEIESPTTPLIEIPNAPKELPNGQRLPAETLPGPGAAASATQDLDDREEYVPPEDLRVTHIVINPVLTGGHNFDRRPGDDGISVVFEPRNADDAYVPRAGDVSIVVLDPAAEGEAQRVARWNFQMDEAVHHVRTKQFGRGLNFNLPWPGDPPPRTRLHLFVRYTSDDGREFQADREIEIREAGEFSNRWTPKSVDLADDREGGGAAIEASTRNRITLDLPAPSGDRATPPGADGAVPASPSRAEAPKSSTSPEEIPAPAVPQWSPFRP